MVDMQYVLLKCVEPKREVFDSVFSPVVSEVLPLFSVYFIIGKRMTHTWSHMIIFTFELYYNAVRKIGKLFIGYR